MDKQPERNPDERQHTWSTRPRGIVWDSWIRVICSFGLGVLAAVGFLGGKSRDVSDLLDWKAETKLTLARLDKDGTYKGMWVESQFESRLNTNTEKIIEIEKSLVLLDRKTDSISTMQKGLDRLEKNAQDQRR